MEDERTLQRIRDWLAPRQLWVTRIQEVFFFRRPNLINLAFLIVYGTCAFIYFQNLGLYSTLFLISLVVYIICVLYCYADDWFVDYLFPPGLKELDASAPNRTRSIDEVSIVLFNLWRSIKAQYTNLTFTKRNRVSIAAAAIAAGIIFTQVRAFWVNFALLNTLMFLPWLRTAPLKQYRAILTTVKAADDLPHDH
jgi:hypothetical protein